MQAAEKVNKATSVSWSLNKNMHKTQPVIRTLASNLFFSVAELKCDAYNRGRKRLPKTGPGGKKMNKKLGVGMVFILLVLLSCASTYSVYSHNLSRGKELMRQGKFHEARTYFVKAAESQQLPEAYAFAATASYKMNDLRAAERYIADAQKHDGRGFSELRIAGYKALIYLKEGRKDEGMKALQEYTTLYSRMYPLPSIEQVEAMIKEDKVDLVKLETLLDEQITRYENDIDQFQRTGTGFYDKGGDGRLVR